MKNIYHILFILLISIFCSCAGTKTLNEISIKDKFEIGMENLNKEKYLQAQLDFNNVLIRGTGSDYGDDAQFYLGESYYRNKEYLSAITEFEKLTRRMGFSEYVEEARFKICESYKIESPKYFHDQEYTQKALERYQEFIDDYPESKYLNSILLSIKDLRNKMANKLYQTGVLYIKMEEYKSAKIAFKSAIDSYYDTDIIHLAKQGLIIASAKNLEIASAIELLSQNELSLKDNKLYKEASLAIRNNKKILDKIN
jgi:outer membrane protein assembly factor BamD